MEALEESELCFPQLLNTSCRRPTRPHAETLSTSVLLLSVSLLTVCLNLLVVVSISHFKQLHTPTNLLLLSLAVSDLCVGLFMLFQVNVMNGCWLLGEFTCVVYQYLPYTLTSASVGTMVLISVDRYVAVCNPLHYSTTVTLRTARMCVSLCWFCSVVYPGLNLQENLKQPGRFNSCVGECVILLNYVTGLVDLIVSFLLPISVIVVLYMRVFVVAVSQARAMRSQVAAVSVKYSVTVTVKKSELKAARTLGVVIVVFLLCLCPFYCVSLANLTSKVTLFDASPVAYIICLFYLNSCLNPLIYAFFYPWFRKSVKFIVTLKILRLNSRQANVL